MSIRPIIPFPDQRLRQIAASVITFDTTLRTLAADLLDTLRSVEGLGITAPHIGVGQRVVVLNLPDSSGLEVYINPEILWLSAETAQHEEGSISMPGISAMVTRPATLKLRYADLNGHIQEKKAEGLRSVCLQHEIDQLDGIFWLQRLSSLRRNRLMARYKKLRAS